MSLYKIRTNGKVYEERIYTYSIPENAKISSMDYIITRVDINDKWVYYYRGKPINLEILEFIGD